MRFFFASSTPLRIASGTSPALPRPDADVARAVTDDDDRAEAEAPAALDDLGDAVDLDDALFERQLVGVDACHGGSFLEVEAGFARGIGERLDPPVVPEPGAVEDDLLDAGGLGALGDERADRRPRSCVLVPLAPRSSGSSDEARGERAARESSMTWA